MADKIKCSVAFSPITKEKNMANILNALVEKKQDIEIVEIIVVSSASTDGTDEIVGFVKSSKGAFNTAEDERRGKSAAINLF